MNNWRIRKIQEIAKTTSGGTPSRKIKAFYLGHNLWVKSGELNDNYIDDTEEKITDEAIKKSSAKLFPAGTVLMAMYGATVGKTAILNKAATTNQAICGILSNDDHFNNEFLRFQLMHKREEFLSQRYGGAQPNISQTIIKNFEVFLPNISEQRTIAHILSTVQKAIEKQDQLIRTTTELKKALMQKLFTEGLRGERQKETEIGLVPESWEVVEFEEFCILKRGRDLPKAKFINGEIPVAGSNGIIGFHNQKNYDGPGVTVGRSGSCGAVQYYEMDFWAHNTSLVVENFKQNNPRFTYYLLTHLNLRQFASGVSVPTLNRNSFRTFLIAKPTVEEQIEIAQALDVFESKIKSHQLKKQTLTDLFKTLLHELMTGQVDVSQWEQEEEQFPIAAEPEVEYKKSEP